MGVPEGETVNEIRGFAETLRDYAPPSDWGSNLFAGIVYFALGDKDEAINCVEYGNVVSGRETGISGVILAQMKRGKIDVASLPEELRGLFGKKNGAMWGYVDKEAISDNPERITEAVYRVAGRKNLSIVIDRFSILIGGEDITQDVMSELQGMN